MNTEQGDCARSNRNARLLGHSDPSFALDVYITVLPADLPEGEALAAAVGLP